MTGSNTATSPFQHLPRTPPRPTPPRCSATQSEPRHLGVLHRHHKAQHDQITKCGCRTRLTHPCVGTSVQVGQVKPRTLSTGRLSTPIAGTPLEPAWRTRPSWLSLIGLREGSKAEVARPDRCPGRSGCHPVPQPTAGGGRVLPHPRTPFQVQVSGDGAAEGVHRERDAHRGDRRRPQQRQGDLAGHRGPGGSRPGRGSGRGPRSR
jgi:hypothetical protein